MAIPNSATIAVILLSVVFAGAQSKAPSSADRERIERLHQEDVAATLSGDPKALADLFTDDALLLQPDSPAIIGKQAILSVNQKEKAQHPSSTVLAYNPEIHDLQILDGWAFEWTTFEASFKESEDGQPKTFHAKALRVLRREPDGKWKFSKVMWNSAP
jgi:uncharacterized protein (TIGR02246 family)